MSPLLIIEDDQPTREALLFKLHLKGIDPDVAIDGESAIEKVKGGAYRVILLDLIIPKKDGFAVLEEIKRNEQLAHATIFVCSNLGQREQIEKARSLGAHEFIEKTKAGLGEIVDKLVAAING